MELSHPNVIFKLRVLGLAQTPAKHSMTKGVLTNKCPAQMELLWGNLVVLLHLCNQLNGSPGPNLSAAQEHRESLNEKDRAGGSSWLHQLPPPPPWCPGPGRASQIHRGAANPLQSWDYIPKMILFHTRSLCSWRAPHTQHPLEGQHGLCKLRGRKMGLQSLFELDMGVQFSSATELGRHDVCLSPSVGLAGLWKSRQHTANFRFCYENLHFRLRLPEPFRGSMDAGSL